MEIKIYSPRSLDQSIHAQIDSLTSECFKDVPKEEIIENFYAKPFAILVYLENQKVFGTLSVYKRKVLFDGKNILLGGIGGVCVDVSERRKGIGSLMVQKAIEYLEEKGCEVVCLNVDLEKKIYGVYEKLGFVMMGREISFENVYGKAVKEKGTMFAPLKSKETFDYIMNSSKTFHYGKGYW